MIRTLEIGLAAVILLALLAAPLRAGASGDSDVAENVQRLLSERENLDHRLDVLEKKLEDVLWHERVGDIAVVEKVRIHGPPKWKEENPDAYRCAFAGVPVSDLVMRMGVWGPDYQAYYDAEHHIGQTPAENLEEYKRRSPVWHVKKLRRPLRIHTNPRDEDVTYIEVERLIQALKAAEKDFEYEVYDVPGGHSFDRLDTPEAWRIRAELYRFLAKHLKPPKPDVRLGLQASGRAAP